MPGDYPRDVTSAATPVPAPAANAPSRGEPARASQEEHAALTTACGLVDRSERGKLALTGPGAVEFLNGQITNDVARLAAGEGCYAAFLTHKGKMLGDLRVLAVGVEELLLDTERVALQALFDMIRRFKLGYDVELHKRTLECALLSLVGPNARAIAAAACSENGEESELGDPRAAAAARLAAGRRDDRLDLPVADHSHRGARVGDAPVRLVATEASGVDVLCDASDRAGVRDALIAAGARPVSDGAAEVLRVERGVPRYGVDLDDSTIPQEAGLNERAVSFDKGCYVGQETVARLHYKGKPTRHLRGLRLSEPAASGAELRLGDRVVGALGSVAVSPRLGPIGLALVRREAEPGARVAVGGDEVAAEVVALPFP